ncbi:transposase family protein [Paraflavitalea speifideaquila]|uniref:integrase catalytic domain-containing protein n=1 Tax=Paraflavitalea speifideaquila TaxID=3076558 RepID=UPI0028E2196E|nr:transposase family protein [Paraflavitalea speifideiaquila]
MEERYDPAVYNWLRQLSGSPVKLTNAKIHEAIVKLCKEANINVVPSVEWVKKHRRRALKNHEIFKSRYGAQAAINELEPYAKINHAKNANSQWQIDGFTLPFYFGKIGEYNKLVFFAVVDSHSKKMLGYSFGESENTLVIFAALKDAVSNTGYLPAEFVCDNHSFNKTDEAKDLKTKLDSYGIHWTVSHNPRYKSILERTFKHFNEHFLKNYPGWTGQGILTKDKEGRPAQEYIDKFQKAGYRLTEDQIRINVIEAVEHYNNTVLKKHSKTPAQMYSESSKPHAIEVNLFEQARIFIPCKKAKVQRGQINITRRGVLYEYQLSADLMHQYNNQEVFVRYENLHDEIYISILRMTALLE